MRTPLAKLFGGNPLHRVNTLMDRVLECAERVPELVDALVSGDQQSVAEMAKAISALEARADDAKNAVRSDLPVRVFLPVDRRDLLRLVSELDSIADCAEDVGVLLTHRTMETPDEMKTMLALFVERVVDVVRTAATLVHTLDSLMAASFGRRAAKHAQGLIDELARKEHEADKIQDQIAKVLFSLENELPPISVFMWTKILNKLGDMANHAENVGDQFRLFIAR